MFKTRAAIAGLLHTHTSRIITRASLTTSTYRIFTTTRTTMAPVQDYKLNLDKLSLEPGQKQEVTVDGLGDGAKVLLVNIGGNVSALAAKCTHYGAPLVKGVLTPEGRLTCPWHGGEINVWQIARTCWDSR